MKKVKFLHRVTKQCLYRGNTPDFLKTDWIHWPDMIQVERYLSKYWIITGDKVSLMSQTYRDAIDAVELNISKDNTIAIFEDKTSWEQGLLEILVEQFNLRPAGSELTVQILKDQIRNKLGSS